MVRNYYTDDELIEMLSTWIEIHGFNPTMDDIDRDKTMPNASVYKERFFKFRRALALAKDTDAERIEALRGALEDTEKEGFIPTINWCIEHEKKWMVNYANRYFGGWRDAISALGFADSKEAFRKKRREDNINRRKEQVTAIIKNLHTELGRILTKDDINNCESLPSYWVCVNLFGCKDAFYEETGMVRHLSTQQGVIDAVKEFYDCEGALPQYGVLQKVDYELWKAIGQLFDRDYLEVLRLAGLDYKTDMRIEWRKTRRLQQKDKYDTIQKLMDGVLLLVERNMLPELRHIRSKDPQLYASLRHLTGGYPVIQKLLIESDPRLQRYIKIPRIIRSKKERYFTS